MSEISIPESEFPVLSKIVDLDSDSFSQFSKVLAETVPPLGREKYISLMSSKLPRLDARDFSRMLNTIVALYRAKEKMGMSPLEMANLIQNAAEESSEHGKLFEKSRRDILGQRLAVLLSFNNTLGLGTKCVMAMLDSDTVCYGTKISTDMRPVFDDSKEVIIAGAINHTLRIISQKESDFCINLDDNDLQELKEQLENAQKSSVKLKAFLEKSNLFYLK